jgi:hypothetical protein
MTFLYEQINSKETFKEQVEVVKNYYLSKKMDSPLEPEWIHLSYNLAFRYLDGEYLSDDEILDLNSIVESHCLADGFSVPSFPGFPNSSERIMHEGWKAGTATWVFMGRNTQNAHILKGKWVAVSRSLPHDLFNLLDREGISDTLWIAYNLDFPFGSKNDSKKCIGPALFYEDLKDVVSSIF